jgi:hypothetical protein
MQATSRVLAGIILSLSINGVSYCQHIHWHVATPVSTLPRQYTATAIGVYGDTVFVASTSLDSTGHSLQVLFQRSVDAGITWQLQNPHFADRHNLYRVHALCAIDGRTVLAATDSGYLLTTHDAGSHWDTALLSRKSYPADIHFYSPSEGMIVCRGDTAAYLTTDGGEHWLGKYIPMSGWGMRGLALGHGRFRLFSYGYGSVYTTNDYWQNFDTTLPLSPQTDLIHVPVDARMEDSDNYISYGTAWTGDPANDNPFIARSTNAGQSWDTITPSTLLHNIQYITQSDRDTVFALGEGYPEYLLSFDRGHTWVRDTLVTDGTRTYYFGRRVVFTTSGRIIGIWQRNRYDIEPGEILVGTFQNSSVEGSERILTNSSVYPNPASTAIKIMSADYDQPILVYNILGHEVLHGKVDGTGHAQFDVSALPRGVYSVILKHNGIPLSIGKVAVVSK